MWQSCPPSNDEIVSSLQNQLGALNKDYKELRKTNNDLEDRLMDDSRNKELIRSLKRQRTYLGKLNTEAYFLKPSNFSTEDKTDGRGMQ